MSSMIFLERAVFNKVNLEIFVKPIFPVGTLLPC